MKRLTTATYKFIKRMGDTIKNCFYQGRIRRPLYLAPLIEDLLFGQPVNLPLRLVRRLVSGGPIESGITVIVVNYNTTDLLKRVLPAIRKFSPGETRVIVLDNSSPDGGWAWLRSRPHGVRPIRIPVNVGHGRALDLGVALARTRYVVTLDSDAFPISSDWLDRVISPLESGNYVACGAPGPRNRLHPKFAAYVRDVILASNISFANYKPHLDVGEPPVFGENCWDTGEYLFKSLEPSRVNILPIKDGVNGCGEVVDDVVYHQCAMTGYDLDGLDNGDNSLQARRQRWDAACGYYLNESG